MNFNKRLLALGAVISVLLLACAGNKVIKSTALSSKAEVIAIINKVNSYWQAGHPEPGNAFWDESAYHTGNMAAWEVTKNQDFLEYSKNWADHNQWMGAKSKDRSQWKYQYGETDDHVLFGDWQILLPDLHRPI